MTQNLWYFQHHEVTPGVFPLILFHFSTTPSTFSHCRSALYFFIISIFCSEIQLHSSFSFHQAWKLLGQLTWFMVSPPLAPVQWNEFNLIFDLSIDYGVFTISSFQIWYSLEYLVYINEIFISVSGWNVDFKLYGSYEEKSGFQQLYKYGEKKEWSATLLRNNAPYERYVQDFSETHNEFFFASGK